MKTFARIQDGTVAELFSTGRDIRELFHPSLQWVAASEGAQVGWLWDGEDMAPAPVVEPEPVVPGMVSRFQAKAAMARSVDGEGVSLLSKVELLMEQAPVETQLAWTDAQEFRRTSPTLLTMGAALGLDSAALDDLFTVAAEIEA